MSGLYWTAGGKFFGQLITWIITIIVIRLLEPADYGLVSLTSVFVGFLTMLNELGLGAAIVQKREIPENTLKALFSIILLISILFYLFLFAIAPVISLFYNEPRLVKLINVLALQFVFMGFTVLPQSLLLREMAFSKLAKVEFFASIIGALVTLILAFLEYGVWALVWGTLAIRIVSVVGLNVVKPVLYSPQLVFKGIKEYFYFGGYVTLSRILWYFYITADILIVGKILGKDLLGFYSVGVYLANLPMEKLSGLINQVAFPAFSSISSNIDVAALHFLKAVRVMSFIAFPVLWGISSIAPEIVDIFLGHKWGMATLPLLIIAVIVPVRMVHNLINPTALGLGMPKISFLNSLFPVFLMPLSFVIGSFWGLLGVSLAWVIAFPVVFMVNISRISKILGVRIIDIFKAMQKPFVFSLIMAGLIQILRLKQFFMTSDIPRLVLFIIVGSTTYLFLSFVFNKRGLLEIRNLIRS
ncbi:lipopolysaccharide biosynthesis protein [bacterium]|nr:lipopolysaccharide biosynthesis protein [bacterium]